MRSSELAKNCAKLKSGPTNWWKKFSPANTARAFGARAWSLTASASTYRAMMCAASTGKSPPGTAKLCQTVRRRAGDEHLPVDRYVPLQQLRQEKEIIAEISATLALSAIRNNDRVGAIFLPKKWKS